MPSPLPLWAACAFSSSVSSHPQGSACSSKKKVDYTKSRNLILTAVTMISGLSGATVTLGPVQLKGMGLATIVAMILSLSFLIFDRLHLSNDKK